MKTRNRNGYVRDWDGPASFSNHQNSLWIEAQNDDDAGSFLISMIDSFLRDSDQMLAGLRDAIATSNHKQINEIAHSLKSMSASMGATQLAQLYNELENMGKTETLIISPNWIQILEQEVERARLALTQKR